MSEVTQWTDARGYNTSAAYNANGQATSVTDPLFHSISTAYDLVGRVSSVTDAANNTGSYAYWPNAHGALQEYTDPRGFVTHTNLPDYTNKLQTTVRAYGLAAAETKQVNFDAVALTSSIRSVDLNIPLVTYGRDTLNQVTTVKDTLNNTTTLGLDTLGATTLITDAQNRQTSINRDIFERQTKVTDASGVNSSPVFDANDEQVAGIDGLGHVTRSIPDALGRTSFQIDALGGVTRYQYDGAGNLLALTDPVGARSGSTTPMATKRKRPTRAAKSAPGPMTPPIGLPPTLTSSAGRKSTPTSTTTFCRPKPGRTPAAPRSTS